MAKLKFPGAVIHQKMFNNQKLQVYCMTSWTLLSWLGNDPELHISVLVFKAISLLKRDAVVSISKDSCNRNRFHVTLHIPGPEICEQSLPVKRWKAEARAEKANKLKTKMNKSKRKLCEVQNWKVGHSQIIAFTETEWARKPYGVENHAEVTQHRAFVEYIKQKRPW